MDMRTSEREALLASGSSGSSGDHQFDDEVGDGQEERGNEFEYSHADSEQRQQGRGVSGNVGISGGADGNGGLDRAAVGADDSTNDKLGKHRCSMFEGMTTFSQACSVFSRAANNGRGLFAQSYLVFIINALKEVWREVYGEQCFGDEQKRNVSVATLVGAVCGMFVFGLMLDTIGKRNCAVVVSLLTLIGAVGAAVVPPYELYSSLNPAKEDPQAASLINANVSRASCKALFDRLSFGLFVIGLGFGGEYPVSASLASDGSKQDLKRGRDVLLTFSMQGWANVAAVLVVAILYDTKIVEEELVWRVSIAVAAIIIMWTLVERIIALRKDKETRSSRRERDSKSSSISLSGGGNVNAGMLISEQSHHNKPVEINFRFVLSHYGFRLLGTSLSWFLLDVVFYGNALFAGVILTAAIGENVQTEKHFTYLLLFAMFAMPGYYAAAFTIDQPWLGRKKLQTIGFIALGSLYIFIGLFFLWLKEHVSYFITIYAIAFFFSGFGPNSTTFLLPSEIFATQIRGTMHGVSAASGKLGAVVGVFLVAALVETYGSNFVLVLLGSTAFIGAVVTKVFIPDSIPRSMEQEDASFAEAFKRWRQS